MTDEEFYDRMAEIERKIDEALTVRAERVQWNRLFDLYRQAGKEGVVEMLQSSVKYRKFAAREAWQDMHDKIVVSLPLPVRRMLRKRR